MSEVSLASRGRSRGMIHFYFFNQIIVVVVADIVRINCQESFTK